MWPPGATSALLRSRAPKIGPKVDYMTTSPHPLRRPFSDWKFEGHLNSNVGTTEGRRHRGMEP